MRQKFRFLAEQLYLGLLSLYPHRFRTTFGKEIEDIFLRIADEAEKAGNFELLVLYFYELKSLVISILREHWHEWESGKEKKMASENDSQDVPVFQNGGASFAMVGVPNWSWIFRWTLLMTAAIVAGGLLMAPFTALMLFIVRLGTNVGLFSGVRADNLEPVGLFAGLALTYSTSQWLMLRNYLPRTKTWFLGTGAGFLAAGIIMGSVVPILNDFSVNSSLAISVYFLLIGVCVGIAQWMVLHRILQNAIWILVINVLAAGSFLLSGNSLTSLSEFLVFLMLPGLVTGVGIWILLKQSQASELVEEQESIPDRPHRRSIKWPWAVMGLVSLILLFFLYSWIYATSQIELAKNKGIYATAEEAVIARNSQGWGGAQVVKVVGVHAGPNRRDGSQPHVWFGGGTVYLDRVPQGWDREHYLAGSFYIHVREGWVHVPEGAFPEFIGWVMELYNLEGVTE
jgi:hypothetical protein